MTDTSTGTKENPLLRYEAIDGGGLNYAAIYQDGQKVFFTGPDNPLFVDLQTTALPVIAYVPPEPLPPLSTEAKVDNMLQAFGLTREEMQAALAVKTKK